MTIINKIKLIPENKLMMSIMAFTLAVLTAMLFYSVLPPTLKVNESPDFHYYYQPAAVNFLEGRGLTTHNGIMLTRYPPLHSILIALAITPTRVLNIDQNIGIYALTWCTFGLISVLIYLIANQYWDNWLAIIPSLLWMTYLPALWSAKQPNSEIPFILFLLIGVWLLIKTFNASHSNWLMFLLIGVIFGLSMLIRPIAAPIGFLLFIFVLVVQKEFVFQKRSMLATCLLLGAYLPALLWGLHLQNKTGQFAFLSTSGLPAMIDGLTFSARNHGYRQDNVFTDRLSITQTLQSAINEKEPATTTDLLNIIAEISLTHPVAVIQLFLIKAIRSWCALDSMRYEAYIMPYQVFYLVMILVSAVLAIKGQYITKKAAILIVTMVISFWGMTTVALSILRYMLPIFPLLFIFTPSIFRKLQFEKNSEVH